MSTSPLHLAVLAALEDDALRASPSQAPATPVYRMHTLQPSGDELGIVIAPGATIHLFRDRVLVQRMRNAALANERHTLAGIRRRPWRVITPRSSGARAAT